MTFFERIIGGEIFVEVWRQMRGFLFQRKRWRQLLSLEPIEIYTTDTELNLDNMKIRLHIKAFVENLVQRRLERAKDFFTLNVFNWPKDPQLYSFHVEIDAQTNYEEISKFFTHHFGYRKYEIVEDKYSIFLQSFHTGPEGTKARAEIPFYVDVDRWFFKKRLHGTVTFKGSITFNNPIYTIRIRNLDYSVETKSWILKIVDWWYRDRIIEFLTGFLVYNFKEELFHAKVHAQEEINTFQQEYGWVNGTLNELELEKVTIDPDALRGTFQASGKLYLVR